MWKLSAQPHYGADQVAIEFAGVALAYMYYYVYIQYYSILM